MLKHCNKSDKITKINYQQPHYLLYYCHLCENNEYYGTKREALLVRTESQFCHQSYQNSIEKHECTFMLHKKRDNYYKKKKKKKKLIPKKLFHARKVSILISLWSDYEAILPQIALYPFTGFKLRVKTFSF